MTPEQQAALENLAGRTFDGNDLAALDPMVAGRDDMGIATYISIGRLKTQSRMLNERGVIAALGVVAGDAALQALDAFSVASLPDQHPLKAAQPGIARMLAWLKTNEGIDIGNAEAQQLLGAFGAIGILDAEAAQNLAALAQVADPVAVADVSRVLNDLEV